MIRVILICVIMLLSIAAFAKAKYIVIDVSGGPSADEFPVMELDDLPDDGRGEEYKTYKIALKRIDDSADGFYIGVFEVTQRQWELVTGKRPSYYKKDDCYQSRPVDSVSYDDIRGKNKGSEYPKSSEVDEDSFVGIIRSKAKLPSIDIPTRRQWEIACGGTGGCNDAENCEVIAKRARLGVNCGYYMTPPAASRECGTDNGTARVGSYEANSLGLYDMHGNVCEWCLDSCDESDKTLISLGCSWDEFRPFGKFRVLKGGHCESTAPFCKLSRVYGENSSFALNVVGLRLVCR